MLLQHTAAYDANIASFLSDEKLIFLKIVSNVIKSGMNIVGVSTPTKM